MSSHKFQTVSYSVVIAVLASSPGLPCEREGRPGLELVSYPDRLKLGKNGLADGVGCARICGWNAGEANLLLLWSNNGGNYVTT